MTDKSTSALSGTLARIFERMSKYTGPFLAYEAARQLSQEGKGKIAFMIGGGLLQNLGYVNFKSEVVRIPSELGFQQLATCRTTCVLVSGNWLDAVIWEDFEGHVVTIINLGSV